MSTDAEIRLAADSDLPTIAEVYLAARDGAAMPPGIHPPDDVRAWVASWDLASRDVWVAESGGSIVGFANLTPTWLDGLYVAPGAQRGGIGSTLVDLAKSVRPDGFGLWVFETNVRAQEFYRRHGLLVVRRTDGSDNEERAPDLEMAWVGPDRLAGIRRRIDALDGRLAALLNERALLTAAAQEQKPVAGHAGRDVAREAEIVARMAELAPDLGHAAMARIMHAVISASLDAAE